jgi:hypothetical protein
MNRISTIRFGTSKAVILLLLIWCSPQSIWSQTILDTSDSKEPLCYVGERPACEISWSPLVDAVFLGTITDVKNDPNVDKSDIRLRLIAKATVDEPFIGIKDKTVNIATGGDSDPFPFSRGLRYVIYGRKMNDGTIKVYSCGGTKWENIEPDIKYLRSLPSIPATARVYGSAYRYNEPYREDSMAVRRIFPLKDKVILVKGETNTFKAVVDKDGNFDVEGLPPGAYFIDIQIDEPAIFRTASGFYWRAINEGGFFVKLQSKECFMLDISVDPSAKPNPNLKAIPKAKFEYN